MRENVCKTDTVPIAKKWVTGTCKVEKDVHVGGGSGVDVASTGVHGQLPQGKLDAKPNARKGRVFIDTGGSLHPA